MFKRLNCLFLCLGIFISNAFAFQIRMQTLYITDGTVNSIIHTMLNSYGIPFDTATLPVASVTLENESGALYNSIVIEGATSVNFPVEIKTQIEDYQKKYSVRVAYLNSEPDTSKGFSAAAQAQNVVGAQLTTEGVKMAEKIQMKGNDVFFEIPNSSVYVNNIILMIINKISKLNIIMIEFILIFIYIFKINDSDSVGTVTSVGHYEPTITDPSALEEFLKYNNTEAGVNINNIIIIYNFYIFFILKFILYI